MKWTDLISLGFENLRRRKGRTFLTILGTVVGTCSIVVMVSLGIAMNVGYDQIIAEWGDLTQIQVISMASSGEGLALDDRMVAEIKAIDHVVSATPLYRPQYLNGQFYAGRNDRYQANIEIIGVYPQAAEELGYNLISGTYLDQADSDGKKIPVLLGQFAGYRFIDTRKQGEDAYRWQGQVDAAGNPLDPFVNLETDRIFFCSAPTEEGGELFRYELKVVGVMEEDLQKSYLTSQSLLMDMDQLKKLEQEYLRKAGIREDAGKTQEYTELYVKVDDIDQVKAVEEKIQEYGYQTYSAGSERETMQQQGQMIQLILGGIGAVSLFVAALSIANTMTMAIYERTREIGIMKVLGCKLGKIRQMFLIEAGLIGFAGGLFGVGVSYLASFALNYFGSTLQNTILQLPTYGTVISVIPPWLALLGVLFSTVIGLLSGMIPANRAVKISALEAIRHE